VLKRPGWSILGRLSSKCHNPEVGLQLLATILLTIIPPPVAAAESPLLHQLKTGALSGDLRPLDRMIETLEPASLAPVDATLLQAYRERFLLPPAANPADPAPGFADSVIRVYQAYWRSVLGGHSESGIADGELQDGLRNLLREHYPAYRESLGVFVQLEAALAARDLGHSLSFTAPWRDLYIWGSETTGSYTVELTDGPKDVEVTFLQDLLVQGWQHYASMDLLGTSGWATAPGQGPGQDAGRDPGQDAVGQTRQKPGLYCLCWSYALQSDAFLQSWLKHETRHLADLEQFPGLPEARLEYRAKLTELAFAGNRTGSLLQQFADTAQAGSESAHASANFQVVQAIYQELFQQEQPRESVNWLLLGPARVGPVARKLLEADTAAMPADMSNPIGLEAAWGSQPGGITRP
jgi:hypothetical protein